LALPRGPITLNHLRVLHSSLVFSEPRDAAIWAAALAAFWGCRRLGELLIVSTKKFTLQHDVTRSTHISRSNINNHSVFNFHLPWTKTTSIIGGECILTATNDDFCPVSAMDNHLQINHSPNRDTPMFSFRNGSDWVPLLKKSFIDSTNTTFKIHSLENIFGHSYRIGGSLKLLLDGVPPETVMKVGGWTSLCFLIYWRCLEQVIPLAITHAWESQIKTFATTHSIHNDVVDINFDDE
jgi:hypothetical protein